MNKPLRSLHNAEPGDERKPAPHQAYAAAKRGATGPGANSAGGSKPSDAKPSSKPSGKPGSSSGSGAETGSSTGAEAAVVEGANSITATDSSLTGYKQHGVMLYQSMSGDAQAGTGSYTMVGGKLTAKVGPAFYVTNEVAHIALSGGAKMTTTSGVLVRSDSAGTGSDNAGAGMTSLNSTLDGKTYKLSGGRTLRPAT